MSVRSTAHRRPAAELVGSLAVVAAAAGIAGLGTFGSFTDSTAPLAGDVATGTVSIDLAAPAAAIEFPAVDGGWMPGDRAYVAVDLVNTGTAPLGSLVLAVTATQSSLLDSDTTDGLQLTIQGCDEAWSTDGGTYSCEGAVTSHYTGPVVLDEELPRAASLVPGGVDHLLATVTLPETAGNQFMGAETGLSVLFTGTQRGGTSR